MVNHPNRRRTVLRSITMNVEIFIQGAMVSYRALFSWLDPVTYLASKILLPVGQILFFSLLGQAAKAMSGPEFYIVGNALQATALSGVYGVTQAIVGDRNAGTLLYVLGSPSSRFSIFFGRATFHIIDGIAGALLILVFSVLFGFIDVGQMNITGTLLAVITAAFGTSCIGLVIGGVALVTRDTDFLNNTVYFGLLALSGANFPIDILPKWLQHITVLIPLTGSIEAARKAIEGAKLVEFISLLKGDLLQGLSLALMGLLIFITLERTAYKKGSLDIV